MATDTEYDRLRTVARPSFPSDPESAPPRFSPGDIVGERYRIESLLGEGGMGSVYLAEHTHMHKRVALKVLHAEFSESPEIVARFEREAMAAAHVDNEHVAKATDFGHTRDGVCFLVLEYVDGRTLRDVLDEGALSPVRALHIARGVTQAIGAAHAKGVVHRDLKPENIMLVVRPKDAEFVKVLDFGIARGALFAGAAPLTQLGTVIGTPDYMSPEQALGNAVDARSDLYALGVILFEMLAGTRPFEGSGMTVLRQHALEPAPPLPVDSIAGLPSGLDAVVAKLLSKAPAERHQTAQALGTALEALEKTLGVPASGAPSSGSKRIAPSSPRLAAPAPTLLVTKRLGKPRSLRPYVLATTAALIVAALLVVLFARPAPERIPNTTAPAHSAKAK